MQTVRKKAYVILDGTVLPIDRIAADQPYYLRKRKHHGMNVQVLADPAGRLIWASDALPGAVHDLAAARTHGITTALTADSVKCWADKAYQGAGAAVRDPFRGKNLRGWRRRHNRDHARSAPSANAPWPPSNAGGSCESSAAAPRGSPPSSERSSPSNSSPDQDGKGSVSRHPGVNNRRPSMSEAPGLAGGLLHMRNGGLSCGTRRPWRLSGSPATGRR